MTQKKLKNELTWSFSRHRLFKECRRAYFYQYYASWGGWEKDADQHSRKAYILKNIRNIDAWIGDVVHQVIKWIIESKFLGSDISHQDALKKSKEILVRTWEASRNKLWTKSVKYNLNLFEHYYNREPTREELTAKLQKVTKSIRNFYESSILKTIYALKRDDILTIDELDSFDFEGIKIFAAPDFAFREKFYRLYDWKTGKENEQDLFQLSCYALYAVKRWKADPSAIQIFPVYLSEEKSPLKPIRVIDIEDVKDYIRLSINEMKSLLLDSSLNKINPEVCIKTGDSWRCNTCKFQEICQ